MLMSRIAQSTPHFVTRQPHHSVLALHRRDLCIVWSYASYGGGLCTRHATAPPLGPSIIQRGAMNLIEGGGLCIVQRGIYVLRRLV